MARRIKGGMKRSETEPASSQFPKCSPQSRTHKRFTELCREENGEGEIEVTCSRNRRLKRGREQSGQ